MGTWFGGYSPLLWKGIVGGDSIHWSLCGGWSVELCWLHGITRKEGEWREEKEGRKGGREMERRERRGRRKKRKEEGKGGKKRRDGMERGGGEETEHLG